MDYFVMFLYSYLVESLFSFWLRFLKMVSQRGLLPIHIGFICYNSQWRQYISLVKSIFKVLMVKMNILEDSKKSFSKVLSPCYYNIFHDNLFSDQSSNVSSFTISSYFKILDPSAPEIIMPWFLLWIHKGILKYSIYIYYILESVRITLTENKINFPINFSCDTSCWVTIIQTWNWSMYLVM